LHTLKLTLPKKTALHLTLISQGWLPCQIGETGTLESWLHAWTWFLRPK